jgi:hypothetical protein
MGLAAAGVTAAVCAAAGVAQSASHNITAGAATPAQRAHCLADCKVSMIVLV